MTFYQEIAQVALWNVALVKCNFSSHWLFDICFAILLLKVCQWLLALGMESYITLFMDKTITGGALLNLDSSGLKELGIKNKEDREKIKKKIKELKSHNEREKKDMEKAKHKRENLLKKAEKVIKKKWQKP